MKKQTSMAICVLLTVLSIAKQASANNITVTNLSLTTADTPGCVDVQATVSWDNSWRAAWTELASANVTGSDLALENWDAAWVFFKWRGDSAWMPVTLTATGHTATAGTTITVPADGRGAFIHRSVAGSGTFSATVKLRWNRNADGAGASVDLSAHAIEMVYVPECKFKLGSGAISSSSSDSGCFTDGAWSSGATIPFLVTGEGELTITNAAGHLYGTSSADNTYTIGPFGTLPAAYPKGYAAFYCMKYEITQGQYAEFLNHQTAANAAIRYDAANAGNNRYTISGTHPNFSASAPNRANNFLSWADGLRYVTWSGLRPMTELEFEKACRGPLNPVASEYAWGSTSITQTTGLDQDGTANETSTVATANCVYGSASAVNGPVRAGAFARATTGRRDAGASYWGIMELSGNLWERVITVGRSEGRAFTGVHGTGSWDFPATGWPIVTNLAYGVRGGAWNTGLDTMNRVSDRSFASVQNPNRSASYGWRAVRTAP
ncbi:MAG: SUMF1/EgtB/PvdO family nonheme iron enzyme [Kiritimatiellae bacterium]|nr:SUMF1/EgtB/PvdO family nonheme iron enzyme [Kiritimatiellia bacterium]